MVRLPYWPLTESAHAQLAGFGLGALNDADDDDIDVYDNQTRRNDRRLAFEAGDEDEGLGFCVAFAGAYVHITSDSIGDEGRGRDPEAVRGEDEKLRQMRECGLRVRAH